MPASKLALAMRLPGHFVGLAVKSASALPASGKPLERILVLGYGATGDLIFFLPALRAIRRGFPKARIVFLVNRHPGTTELLPATKLVDELWHYEHSELAHGSARRQIARRVARAKFDAVVATGAAPMRALATVALEAPLRVGQCRALEAPHEGWPPLRYALWRLRRGVVSEEFERRLAFNRKVWTRPAEHSVRRNLRLAEALGVTLIPEDERPPEFPEPDSARAFAEMMLADGRPAIGLHLGPATTQYAKLWKPERWAGVARALADQWNARVVLVGGPEDAPSVKEFSAAFGGSALDLTARCGLLDSFAVIRRCALFLANDTGPGKAAMALGVPTACVWGPSDWREQGAFWEPEKHLQIYSGLPCQPCISLAIRNEGAGVLNFDNCGRRACLSELSAQAVAARILERVA